MGGENKVMDRMNELQDEYANPFYHKTTVHHRLSVIRDFSDPLVHRVLIHPAGYDGKLNLSKESGRFTFTQDDIPFSIVSGLEETCEALRDVINTDKAWQEANKEMQAVQNACIAANLASGGISLKEGDRDDLKEGSRILGYTLSEFLSLSKPARKSAVLTFQDRKLASPSDLATVTVEGIGYFKNIRHDDRRIFTNKYPNYNSYCADSRKFASSLAECMEIIKDAY